MQESNVLFPVFVEAAKGVTNLKAKSLARHEQQELATHQLHSDPLGQ